MMEKGFKGYVFSRPVEGNFTPQRVQNLVIRDYIKKKNKVFLLSATEYYMDDCFLMLDAVVEERSEMDALVFYTTHHLPNNFTHRQKILNTLLNNNVEVHFALEEICLKKTEDISIIEDIVMARTLSAKTVSI